MKYVMVALFRAVTINGTEAFKIQKGCKSTIKGVVNGSRMFDFG